MNLESSIVSRIPLLPGQDTKSFYSHASSLKDTAAKVADFLRRSILISAVPIDLRFPFPNVDRCFSPSACNQPRSRKNGAGTLRERVPRKNCEIRERRATFLRGRIELVVRTPTRGHARSACCRFKPSHCSVYIRSLLVSRLFVAMFLVDGSMEAARPA